MLNTMIVAAITSFSGTTTPDKNGETPIMLQCIAGLMPNRNVLSGTVGRRAGFEVGKTYLVNVRETGYDDTFGPDFTFIKIMELTSGLDIVRAAKEIGDPKIQLVMRPEGFEQKYQRKGDAVEGQRRLRIREGSYHPTVTGQTSHQTADHITPGSSLDSGGDFYEGDEQEFPEVEEPNDLPEDFYGDEKDQEFNKQITEKLEEEQRKQRIQNKAEEGDNKQRRRRQ